jgi:hypothetical protein
MLNITKHLHKKSENCTVNYFEKKKKVKLLTATFTQIMGGL